MDTEPMKSRHQALPVLLVESQPLVAQAMRIALTAIDHRVRSTVCHCVESALRAVRRHRQWCLVFIDLDMCDEHGVPLARQLHDEGLAQRCVAVTSARRSFGIGEARRMGMAGCIDKMASVGDLTAALRSLLDGRPCFPDVGPKRDPLARLTSRQRDVLALLCVGYPTKAIASTLSLAQGTVDNHIANILRTLNAQNRAHAIYKAVAQGYFPEISFEASGCGASRRAQR
ncbi:LuxR family transcriptional regulator [Burkholderia territorii]|uniref:response regulator transcription factor n=1 Tax=Burkholderia territorii TaxID=1503055 RepID=UPI0007573462|nr:response regulator transcription factor [Burkholderia territorii]KVT78522.1 LuxR family transcriptional regulator [Burkholderia territorii]